MKRDDTHVQGNGDEREPNDHHQRPHWLIPADRYAHAHAQAIAINTPTLEQPSFSNTSY